MLQEQDDKKLNDKTGAVILAAGMSTRMGQPKLLLPFNGKPLFVYAVETALAVGLKPVVLVVGEHEEKFEEALAALQGVTLFRNEHFRSGMGTSLKKGISFMVDQEVAASFVLLADQPFVPPKVLVRILECYRQERDKGFLIFRPTYQGQDGHPILFDSALFPEFEELSGDIGGKSIIARHSKRQKKISFENSYWNLDIDTPKDYAGLQNFEKSKE